MSIIAENALAQSEQNSFWLNRGDGNNPQFDPSQGEFHPDIGGFMEFDRYQGSHPYANLRAQIEALFFNPDGLDALLPGGLQDLDLQLLSQGTYNVQAEFTSNTLNYETLIINGASVIIVWDPIAMAALSEPPQVTMVFSPTNGGPHSGPSGFFVQVGPETQPIFGTNPEAYENFWSGRPHGPSEATVNAGHFLVQFQPNRWPDVWVAFQRAVDIARYLNSRKTDPLSPLVFDRMYVEGGSWEGLQASHMAMFAPEVFAGGFGPFFLDMGYEVAQGGWTKLLMSYYTAIGMTGKLVPVPARGHSIEAFVFAMPTNRAASLSRHRTTEPAIDPGWEWAAYSLVRRPSNETLKRPLHGSIGNCDIYHNVHFYMDALDNDPALQPYTQNIHSLQLAGHGGDHTSIENQVFIFDGTEMNNLFADARGFDTGLVNPPIRPSDPPPADPFMVDIYAHTLRDIPDADSWESPLLLGRKLAEVQPWTGATQQGIDFLTPFGSGVFPGAYDSVRVGDFDGDSKVEVIFGNFDGFIEVLEERTSSGMTPEEVTLRQEHRSPPVGWNIQALDVGPLSGSNDWIVFGNAAGDLQKIEILGADNYGAPQSFFANSGVERPGRGFLQWLFLGDFIFSSAGNEVLVQNELAEWYLYDAQGNLKGKTSRLVDPAGGADNFSVGSGKPWVGYWPPYFPTNAELAFAPGLDGRLRNIYWDVSTSQLRSVVVSDDYKGMGRCAQFWDPPGPKGPYILVGALRGKGPDGLNDPSGAGDDGMSLTVINPLKPAGQTIVGSFTTDGTVTISSPLTIEPHTSDQFLVAHSNLLTVIQLAANINGSVSITIPAGIGATQQSIPGIAPDAPPAQEQFVFGAVKEICGVERYTSAGAGSPLRYMVTAPNGRVWVMNHSDLSFARTTASMELPPVPGLTPLPWYSNRSFGHNLYTDYNAIDESLWVDEGGIDYYMDDAPPNKRRLARLLPKEGLVDEYFDVGVANGAPNIFNMRIDPNGVRRITTEDIAFGTVGGQDHLYSLFGPSFPSFGHIQEDATRILQNFEVPIDTSIHSAFDVQGGGGAQSPWPFATSTRLKGQVTTSVELGQRPYGNSIRTGLLPTATGDKTHVIVGTMGGFVYAVDPEAPDGDGLTYHTRDLGWCVVGMDIGDIDGDGVEEILAGTWVDTGTVAEAGASGRHRGHLHLLEPVVGTPEFNVSEIPVTDPDPNGLGLGVWGILIDDVNDDGRPEIWVTDARGYLHCLWRDSQDVWQCIYRSEGLGMYAGLYNKLWVQKESAGSAGLTRWLMVQTPGYIYRLEIHPENMPPSPQ